MLISVAAVAYLSLDVYSAWASLATLVALLGPLVIAAQASTVQADAFVGGVGLLVRRLAIVTLGLMTAAAILAHPISEVLRIDSWPVFLTLIFAVSSVWAGMIMGIAQARDRYGFLAFIILLLSGIRLVLVIPMMSGSGLFEIALVQLCAGVCGILVGLVVVLKGCPQRQRVRTSGAASPQLGWNTAVLSCVALLTSIDVLLSRAAWPASQSGIYAAGSLLTKVVALVAAGVVITRFPHLTRHASRLSIVRAYRETLVVCLFVAPLTLVFFVIAQSWLIANGIDFLLLDVVGFAFLGVVGSLLSMSTYTAIALRQRWLILILAGSVILTFGLFWAFEISTIGGLQVCMAACMMVSLIPAFWSQVVHRRPLRVGTPTP